MKKKKILHIQVVPKLAGVQKVSLEIMKWLPDDKFEKWVLFSDTEGSGDRQQCVEAFEGAGAKVIFCGHLKREICADDSKVFGSIYRLCKEEKFDIVHTHSTKPGIVGRIAARMAGVPYVIHTVHGIAFHKFESLPRRWFYLSCELFASLFSHRIVLVNKYYLRFFKLFKRKTTVIYNGLDYSVYPPLENSYPQDSPVFTFSAGSAVRIEETKPSKVPNNCSRDQSAAIGDDGCAPLKVLFIGRLDKQKDPLTLLSAAHLVVTRFPGVKFTLVGDGELREKCREYIDRNNLQHNITLAGWQGDVGEYYRTHDIFAAASLWEAFGLIFLEAGYYRMPVLATNVEGIPEVVTNGESGILCDPCDPYCLSENIIMLIEDTALRQRMGNAGYERVTTNFTASMMAERYEEGYDRSDVKTLRNEN